MKILHIDPKTQNTNQFNEYVEQGKKIFVLFYLEGCGPCNATRPEWKKIENSLIKYKDNNDIVIADVDQELLKEIKYLSNQPKGFPTIRYISNKGKTSEDYEDSPIEKKDRTIDSFVKWIDYKINNKTGGKKQTKQIKKSQKIKRNKIIKRSKTSKKSKKNKRNGKTKRRL